LFLEGHVVSRLTEPGVNLFGALESSGAHRLGVA